LTTESIAPSRRRESIDRVVCTHLHVDHVGWNTMLRDGKWVATFPRATYLIGGTEWDFFSRTEDAFLKDPIDDSVRPVIAEGRAELVDDRHHVQAGGEVAGDDEAQRIALA